MRIRRNIWAAALGLFCTGSIVQAALNVGVSSPMQMVMIKGQHEGWPF